MPAAWARVEKRAFSAREGRAVIDRPGVPRVRPVIAIRVVTQDLNCGPAGLGLEQPEARGGAGHFGVSYAIVLSTDDGTGQFSRPEQWLTIVVDRVISSAIAAAEMKRRQPMMTLASSPDRSSW
jgi:hypothetical protein